MSRDQSPQLALDYAAHTAECPIDWCDRRGVRHHEGAAHQGVLMTAFADEPWQRAITTIQLVAAAPGHDPDAVRLGLTIINGYREQLSGILTWAQVSQLRDLLATELGNHYRRDNPTLLGPICASD